MRISLSVGLFLAVAGFLAWGCIAWSQEDHTVELPTMYFPASNVAALSTNWIIDANGVAIPRLVERRAAMPPVPALPRRKVSRSISTNDQGERVIVTVEKPVDPAPLPQSRYLTNVFEVACSRCKVVAERIPKRVEETGVNSVPGGDELDLTLYFVCCSKEFRAFSKIFIETPIARLVR